MDKKRYSKLVYPNDLNFLLDKNLQINSITKHMKKYIILALAVLALFSATAFSQTVAVDAGVKYTSALVEHGQVIGNGTAVENLSVSLNGFGLGVTGYEPVSISTQKFKYEFNRADVSAFYSLRTPWANATVGETYKHYNTVTKTIANGQAETFVRLNDNFNAVPFYVQASLDNKTRQVNTEGGLGLSVPVNSWLHVDPSVYVGYNDIADTFPRSVKEIKSNNRYIGGSVALSTSYRGIKASVGYGQNRNSVAISNLWFASLTAKY